MITTTDPLDVLAGFFERRYAMSVIKLSSFTRIITRERQVNATVEHCQQLFKILCTSANILSRIERPQDPKPTSGARQSLHQSLCAFRAQRLGMKSGFLLNDQKNQVGINADSARIRPDQLIDRDVTRGPVSLFPVARSFWWFFLFDSCYSFTTKEDRDMAAVVPCPIGYLTHFIHPQTSAIH